MPGRTIRQDVSDEAHADAAFRQPTRVTTPAELSELLVAETEVVSCELGGGAALLDMRSGTYFGLNPLAARIWSHLAQPVTGATILADLTATYDVSQERAEADLLRTLRTLKEAGLIHVGAEPDR